MYMYCIGTTLGGLLGIWKQYSRIQNVTKTVTIINTFNKQLNI